MSVLENKMYKPDNTMPANKVIEALKDMATISQLLRILGAAGVLASMSLFLLQGWSEGNDVERYLKLLMQTGLLAASGFGLSFLLKENKGARLFFGLGVVSVVANFTILGALIYSIVQFDSGLLVYPDIVTWRVVELSQFWPICLGAVVFLACVSKLSFHIFARQHSSLLTLGFLGLSSLLLLPVRDSLLIALLVLLSVVVGFLIVRSVLSNEQTLQTPGLKFALLSLFMPTFVLVARALSLYEADTFMLLSLSVSALLVIRQSLLHIDKGLLLNDLLRWCQLTLGFTVATLLYDLTENVHHVLASLVFVGTALLLSWDTIRPVESPKSINAFVSVTGLLVFLFQTFDITFGYAWINLLTGFALMVFAKRYNNRLVLVLSSIIIGISLLSSTVTIVEAVINYFQFGNWMMIGLAGAAIIVVASVLERHGAALKLKWGQLLVSAS